jgi:hypothetical protein
MDDDDISYLFGVLIVVALITLGLDITIWRP